jgi:glutaredoxin
MSCEGGICKLPIQQGGFDRGEVESKPLKPLKPESKSLKPTPEHKPDTFTIYGKDNCIYCIKARELLEASPYHGVYYTFNKVDTSKIVIPEYHHTFPIIFFGEDFIGGYTEMRTWLKEHSSIV